jgi:hypothetical protein
MPRQARDTQTKEKKGRFLQNANTPPVGNSTIEKAIEVVGGAL